MRIIRVLLGLVMVTALLGGLSLTSAELAAPASAAPPRATVHYPKKGQTSVAVYRLQQRLVKAKALHAADMSGHYNRATVGAVTKFQKAHHLRATGKVNTATWTALVRQTGPTPKLVVRTLAKRCKVRGRVICVDKTLRKLYYVNNSTVRQIMDTRFGCRRTPTREGTFHIQRKSRHHTSSIFGVYMPYAMFFAGGQAVHWSKAFSDHGYHGCSHGCVNIRDKAGVRWLFDQMHVHDRVVIYRS